MPDHPPPAAPDGLRKMMASAAMALPLETDTEHNEGDYGSGDESSSGFKSYAIFDATGKKLFDSLNSDAIEVHEEFDDDGCYAWDETSRRYAKLIVAAVNALPDLIRELTTLRAGAAEAARLREALEVYEDALAEAEAIFGGEYADHYGPLFDLAMKARDARRAAAGGG